MTRSHLLLGSIAIFFSFHGFAQAKSEMLTHGFGTGRFEFAGLELGDTGVCAVADEPAQAPQVEGPLDQLQQSRGQVPLDGKNYGNAKLLLLYGLHNIESRLKGAEPAPWVVQSKEAVADFKKLLVDDKLPLLFSQSRQYKAALHTYKINGNDDWKYAFAMGPKLTTAILTEPAVGEAWLLHETIHHEKAKKLKPSDRDFYLQGRNEGSAHDIEAHYLDLAEKKGAKFTDPSVADLLSAYRAGVGSDSWQRWMNIGFGTDFSVQDRFQIYESETLPSLAENQSQKPYTDLTLPLGREALREIIEIRAVQPRLAAMPEGPELEAVRKKFLHARAVAMGGVRIQTALSKRFPGTLPPDEWNTLLQQIGGGINALVNSPALKAKLVPRKFTTVADAGVTKEQMKGYHEWISANLQDPVIAKTISDFCQPPKVDK